MTTHSPDEHLGSRYTLVSHVNDGAMGEVWRARDADGRLHAAKILRQSISENPEMVKRFVAERNLLLSVHHPNVVGVHDLVVEGDTLAIIMDLVEGRDLRQMLAASGPLSQSDAALVCAELANGLEAIHEQNIVHRDMKPANVLVDETGETAVPRITDFGVSRLNEAGPGNATMTIVAGTPHYMAPELLMNEHPSPASDLYSLGIMLYELMTGVTPFANRSPAAAMQAQLSLDPGRPEGIDDRVWDIVLWLTHKDPARRPGSAAVAAQALREVSDETQDLPALEALRVPPEPTPVDSPNATVLAPGLAATMLGSGTGQVTGQGTGASGWGGSGWSNSGWASGAAMAGQSGQWGVPSPADRWGASGSQGWSGATGGNGGFSAIGFPGAGMTGPGTQQGAAQSFAQPAPAPAPQQGSGGSSGRAKTVIIILLALLLVAAVAVGFLIARMHTDPSPAPSSASPTSKSPTPTPTPTPSVDSRTQALNGLNDARNQSLKNLTLDGRWVLQLDSKYEGVTDPMQTTSSGSHTFQLPDIYSEYQENTKYAASHGISNILLLKGSDFGKQIFQLPEDTWVTIADPGNISSYDAGLAVCSSLYPNLSGDALLNSCLPRQLSQPHG